MYKEGCSSPAPSPSPSSSPGPGPGTVWYKSQYLSIAVLVMGGA